MTRRSPDPAMAVVVSQKNFLTEPQRHGEVLQSDARHCSCVSHHRRPSMISAMPVLPASFVPFVVHPQRHQGYQNGMR